MSGIVTRREMLQDLLAAGVVLGAGWPVLAQGEEVIPFTDLPAPQPGARVPPSLTNFMTANDAFFAVQHYPVPPAIDPAAYKLRISGLVDRPTELTLADLKKRPRVEHVVGFECSGNNNPRGNPLVGNATWAGTSVARLLKEAGPRAGAREVVFFGADTGTEEITHGGTPEKVEQHFGRALSIDDAMLPDVMLADEMNGSPMPHPHGAPVRLVVPGWYGVANVKWLNHIHVQDTRFMGRFMARDYVTLRGQQVGDSTVWNETSVGRTRLKSAIGRVTRTGATLKATGFALSDGTRAQDDRHQRRRRTVEARRARQAELALLVAAVHLRMVRRSTRRAHHRLARDRREGRCPADRGRSQRQENALGEQRAVRQEVQDWVDRGDEALRLEALRRQAEKPRRARRK